MALFFVLIALGTADEYRPVEENLFSRWDILTLPSACASDQQFLSFPGLGIHPRSAVHTSWRWWPGQTRRSESVIALGVSVPVK